MLGVRVGQLGLGLVLGVRVGQLGLGLGLGLVRVRFSARVGVKYCS